MVEQERIDRALEINNRLEMLDDQDRLVLSAIKAGKPIDDCVIAAHLLVLPRLVDESLEKLQELSLLSPHPKRPKILFLNEFGVDAQKILRVLEPQMFESSPSTPQEIRVSLPVLLWYKLRNFVK